MVTRKNAVRLFLLEVLFIRGDSRDSRASSAVGSTRSHDWRWEAARCPSAPAFAPN